MNRRGNNLLKPTVCLQEFDFLLHNNICEALNYVRFSMSSMKMPHLKQVAEKLTIFTNLINKCYKNGLPLLPLN